MAHCCAPFQERFAEKSGTRSSFPRREIATLHLCFIILCQVVVLAENVGSRVSNCVSPLVSVLLAACCSPIAALLQPCCSPCCNPVAALLKPCWSPVGALVAPLLEPCRRPCCSTVGALVAPRNALVPARFLSCNQCFRSM